MRDMGQVFVLAATTTQVEVQPLVELELVLNVQHVLGLFHARSGTLYINRDVVVHIEFLVALTEPCQRNSQRVGSVGPAQFQPQVKSIRATTVANRIIHKVGVGIVRIALLAIVATVVATAGVLQERKPTVVGGGVCTDPLETPGIFAKTVGLDLMEIASHVVQNGAVGALVVIFFVSSDYGWRKRSLFLSILVSLLLLLAVAFTIASHVKFNHHNRAIVTSPMAVVKSSPEDKSVDKLILHEGTKVNIEETLAPEVLELMAQWLTQFK